MRFSITLLFTLLATQSYAMRLADPIGHQEIRLVEMSEGLPLTEDAAYVIEALQNSSGGMIPTYDQRVRDLSDASIAMDVIQQQLAEIRDYRENEIRKLKDEINDAKKSDDPLISTTLLEHLEGRFASDVARIKKLRQKDVLDLKVSLANERSKHDGLIDSLLRDPPRPIKTRDQALHLLSTVQQNFKGLVAEFQLGKEKTERLNQKQKFLSYIGSLSVSDQAIEKLNRLERQHYKGIYKIKGDGDCGYRSILVAVLHRCLVKGQPEPLQNLITAIRQDSFEEHEYIVDLANGAADLLEVLLKDHQVLTMQDALDIMEDYEMSRGIIFVIRHLVWKIWPSFGHGIYTPLLEDVVGLGEYATFDDLSAFAIGICQVPLIVYQRWTGSPTVSPEGVVDPITLLYTGDHFDLLVEEWTAQDERQLQAENQAEWDALKAIPDTR